MKIKSNQLVVLLALLVGIWALGCDSEDDADDDMEQGDSDAEAPEVSFTIDKASDLMPGEMAELTITVANFTLDGDAVGEDPQDGVGHYHVYWDDAVGTDFLTADAAQTVDIEIPADATDGSHSIRVELYNNDHTPLDPPVDFEVSVVVGAAMSDPSVTFTASKMSDLAPEEMITLTITVEDFTLDGSAMGGAAVAGFGHYHVYWDDAAGTDFLTADATETVEIEIPSDATAGDHSIRVELYNNDHTPLDPAVDDIVDVSVAPAS